MWRLELFVGDDDDGDVMTLFDFTDLAALFVEQEVRHRRRRLHQYLADEIPYASRITVADNASTDATLAVAGRLAAEFDNVRVVHLDEKGRGRALRTVYDDMLREDVPKDFLDLLRKLD